MGSSSHVDGERLIKNIYNSKTYFIRYACRLVVSLFPPNTNGNAALYRIKLKNHQNEIGIIPKQTLNPIQRSRVNFP